MAKSRSLQQAVRFALATAAGVSALHAQEAAPAPAEAAAPVEEVVVTGSRLQTPNETAISPITTVSAVDIQQTGLTRVEDVLNNLPMVFAGMNSTTSNANDGTATVDLRGLGNQRTLVLVDGLRLGPGSAVGGRNYSDINQIPAALIERVDVLTGGASSVYGADAVAGVVNFILNTHFEGIKIDAGYHFNQHDNNNQDGVNALVTAAGDPLPTGNANMAFGKNVSILMGSNFADNKGNATAYITYDNQGAALQSKTDYSACSLGPAVASNPVPGSLICQGSGTSKGGRFYASTPGGHSFITHTVNQINGQFQNFQTLTGPGNQSLYNYGPLNYYEVPNERWNAGAFVNYDINSHMNVYMSFMAMRNDQRSQIAASGDFFSPSFVPCANPLLTAQEVATLCTPANLAAQGNPSESYNGKIYPGLNMEIGLRDVQGGPRINTFILNSERAVVGMKGDFGDNSAWTYNVSGQHSTVEDNDGNLNYLEIPFLQQGLNALPGANGKPVCGGATGLIPPLVPTSLYFPFNPTTPQSFGANPACVPWNIWAPNAITPAQQAWLTAPLVNVGTVEEFVANGSVSGDLGKYGVKTPMADQGLQVNFGAEWRSERSDFTNDYLGTQGFPSGGGGPVPSISGEFNVKELFTELRMPIASHQPFADDLSLEAGYRYSKYSEGFDTNTYKIGLDWAPVRDVRLRASYQRAVRAPNIGELYAPDTVDLDGSQDPCSGPTPTASQKACALTGVTAAQYGHIPSNPAAQYNGFQGGNPHLTPEVADTYTLGLVLQPRVVPNLTVSADYFDIKINNVIAFVGGDTIINDCLAGLSNPAEQAAFCPLVHRDASGSLWRSQAGYVIDPTDNEGSLATRGIDLKASYRVPMATLGSLLFSLEGTHLQSLTTTPLPAGSPGGGSSYDCVGLFGSTCGAANPKWRHVFNGTWSTPWDGLDVNLRWRYIGSDTSELTTTNPFLQGPAYLPLSKIPAFSYFDLTGTFNLYKSVRLELGVNNLFDKAPPLVTGADCSTASPAGADCNGNTFPGVYDAMGRYLFAHITAQF
jgi:iron complex outermembrane recepter protein